MPGATKITFTFRFSSSSVHVCAHTRERKKPAYFHYTDFLLWECTEYASINCMEKTFSRASKLKSSSSQEKVMKDVTVLLLHKES